MGQKRTQGMIDPITGRISIKLMCLYSIVYTSGNEFSNDTDDRCREDRK